MTVAEITPASLRSGSFDNGVQIVWDSTSIKAADECPRKYYYSLVLGIQGRGSNPHLRFGGLYASALELFYKLRADGADTDSATIEVVRWAMIETWDTENNQPELFAHNAKNRWSLIRTIIWYLDTFGDETDDNAIRTVHLSDGTPAVELSFKLPMHDDDILLAGHMDRIVTYGEQTYVMDQKTTGTTLSPYFFDQFKPDHQMSLYTLAGQSIFADSIRGVMIDAAQIAVGFTRFLRGFTSRTAEELEEWWNSARHIIQQTQRYTATSTNASYAADPAQAFPMRATSCGNYGGCPFRPLCSAPPSLRTRLIPTMYDPKLWDPTKNR